MSESTTEDRQPEPSASDGETLGGPAPTNDAAEKDPNDWISGDDPITAPQKSYLDSLARQAGEELSADMSKAEASQHIERLKSQLNLAN